MATKVVTFRLPEDLMEAITSQSQATGKCKTAVVVDALKQVFGQREPPRLGSIEHRHQQEIAAQGVAYVRQQPVELRREALSQSNTEHQATLDCSLTAGQPLLNEVSPPLTQVFHSQDRGVVTDVSNTNAGVNPPVKPVGGIQNGLREILQQSAARIEQQARMLEQVLSASIDHVCMYDRLGRYTYANRAFLQSFKFERATLYGKTWQQAGLSPEAMQPFGAKLRIALTTGQSISDEISLLTINGVRHYEYILSPILSADSSIEAVVYTARDITERKQAEEALRESEKNYRNLFEWAHDSIFITDSSTHILLDVNEHAARRLGYTRKQLLSIPAEQISPPMDPEHRKETLERLWQTGSVVFEHVNQCKNGKRIPVEISSRVVEYGGQLAIQSFVRDITARKQAEEQVGLYQQILAHAKDAIAILDLQGRYVEQNSAYQALLGYSDKELLGQTAAFHLGKDVFARLTWELIESGSYCDEVFSRTKSGELLALELKAFILRNQANEPIWYLLVPHVTKEGE